MLAVTIPNTALDVYELVHLVVNTLSPAIAVAAGGYLGFLVIRQAMAWGRRFS